MYLGMQRPIPFHGTIVASSYGVKSDLLANYLVCIRLPDHMYFLKFTEAQQTTVLQPYGEVMYTYVYYIHQTCVCVHSPVYTRPLTQIPIQIKVTWVSSCKQGLPYREFRNKTTLGDSSGNLGEQRDIVIILLECV